MSVTILQDALTPEQQNQLIEQLTFEPKNFQAQKHMGTIFEGDDDEISSTFTVYNQRRIFTYQYLDVETKTSSGEIRKIKVKKAVPTKVIDIPMYYGRIFSSYYKIPMMYLPEYPERGYNFTGSLRTPGFEYQEKIVNSGLEHLKKYRSTLIAAHPGAGKTVMSVALASLNANHPVAVVIHLDTLIKQWVDTFKEYTDAKVAIIEHPGNKTEAQIIENLSQYNAYIVMEARVKHIPDVIMNQIGTIIVDEAHRFCTPTKSANLLNYRCKYIIALSATPKRKDGLHSVLEAFAGTHSIEKRLEKPFHTYCVQTCITPVREAGFRGRVNFTKLSQSLMYSDVRNLYIGHLVLKNQSRKILVLTKEKKHVGVLSAMLDELGIRNATMCGNSKTYKDAPVLIGTVSKIGTGFDEKSFSTGYNGRRLDLLIMAVSYSDKAVIEQNVGRVLRAAAPNVIYLCDNDTICNNHWTTFRRWAQNNKGTHSTTKIDLPNMRLTLEAYAQKHIEKLKSNKRCIIKVTDEIVLV